MTMTTMALEISGDADCDGTLTADDCDDFDRAWELKPMMLIVMVLTLNDCNDEDASVESWGMVIVTVFYRRRLQRSRSTLSIMAEDNDCDGALTAEDCDDNDEDFGALSLDNDCDGALTEEDCDDNDADRRMSLLGL